MRTRRPPNGQLRELLSEAAWTCEALARAVNSIGAEAGMALHYDRTTVAHWLSGSRPRPPIPELVAEGFSRRLRRVVSVGATGLECSSVESAARPWWEGDTVTRLIAITQSRRDLLARCAYSLAALAVPSWAELTSAQGTPAQPSGRVGQVEVESAELMTRMFADADSAHGGGYARHAAEAYLRTTMIPWLRADAAPRVRQKLLTTASRLVYLCGFMCFDDERHGVAQRYFASALQLAAEARDAAAYSITLRAMSVQAELLGHHQHAVHLAGTAVRSAPASTPAQTHAFLFGQLAVASAAVGDRHGAMTSLSAAEAKLACANGTQLVGAFHEASWEHQHSAVAAHLGDRRTALTALERSVRHRPAEERRSRAITSARLAELQAAEGRLEQACQTWHGFLDDYPHLTCRRARSALSTLRALTHPHQSIPVVRAVRRRATNLVSTVDS